MKLSARKLAVIFLISVGITLTANRSAVSEEYEHAKLVAFVEAMIQVSKRIEAWRPKIEGAQDKTTRDALVTEATADLDAVVDEIEGISRKEYREIYDTARKDEALRSLIDTILSDRH